MRIIRIFKKSIRRSGKALLLILRRPKGFFDFVKNLFSAFIKSDKAFGMPVHVTIEPTNLCNLNCPSCETGAGKLDRVKDHMRFEVFKAIIDKIYRHANSVLFYYMGEPFLNNEAYRMIHYAHDKGLYVTSCTNGHFINAEQLINSGINEISFQISGITDESHNAYRVGSDLNKILVNIKKLVSLKKSLKVNSPKIIIGFILMKHNESQVNEFLKLTKDLNVDEGRIIEPAVRTVEQGRRFLPTEEKYWLYDKQAFSKGILKPKHPTNNGCNWIYFSTVVLCNGDVVPCCRDAQGDYVMGNILEEDFRSIWNGEKYRAFRKKIKNNQADLKLCSLCSDFGIPTLY